MTTILDALTAAEQTGTAGPWRTYRIGNAEESEAHGVLAAHSNAALNTTQQDAALIALTRNHLPALLAVARAAMDRDGCSGLCAAMAMSRGCTCGHAELVAALAPLLGEAL